MGGFKNREELKALEAEFDRFFELRRLKYDYESLPPFYFNFNKFTLDGEHRIVLRETPKKTTELLLQKTRRRFGEIAHWFNTQPVETLGEEVRYSLVQDYLKHYVDPKIREGINSWSLWDEFAPRLRASFKELMGLGNKLCQAAVIYKYLETLETLRAQFENEPSDSPLQSINSALLTEVVDHEHLMSPFRIEDLPSQVNKLIWAVFRDNLEVKNFWGKEKIQLIDDYLFGTTLEWALRYAQRTKRVQVVGESKETTPIRAQSELYELYSQSKAKAAINDLGYFPRPLSVKALTLLCLVEEFRGENLDQINSALQVIKRIYPQAIGSHKKEFEGDLKATEFLDTFFEFVGKLESLPPETIENSVVPYLLAIVQNKNEDVRLRTLAAKALGEPWVKIDGETLQELLGGIVDKEGLLKEAIFDALIKKSKPQFG